MKPYLHQMSDVPCRPLCSRDRRIGRSLLVGALVLAVGQPTIADDRDDDDDEEREFSKALVLLQLNDTDGDLGFHARIDGDPWKALTIEDPRGRTIFTLNPRRQLKRQGMSEVFFESHEPPFDELSPEAFFKRFPEGEYEIGARTLDGGELESEVQLSHIIPAPASNVLAGGVPLPEDCDEEPAPFVSAPYTVQWDAVTRSHPEIGPDEAIEINGYELVIEREEPIPLKFQVNLDASETQFTVPPELMMAGDQIKVEVLVLAANGNETGTEACFAANGL